MTPKMAVLVFLALFLMATPSMQVKNGDQCFCQLEGKIDDCLCSVDTVDFFNNMKIFPRLQSLLQKPYFRYFQYNARKPCPFWDNSLGKCKLSNCQVKSCKPDEIPPGLKGSHPNVEHNKSKYTKDANENCDKVDELDSSVDGRISDSARESLQKWQDHDNSLSTFCEVDAELCKNCDYVDLTINPERYTGYSGEAAHKIWRAIYEENCFTPAGKTGLQNKNSKKKGKFSAAFLQDTLEDMCLEKRAFYRAVSGLHASITIHLCANYLLDSTETPFANPVDKFGPNLVEFQRRFDPDRTKNQGPYWLRNLYFVYLLELRALTKVAPYLESHNFYTGKTEEDKETQIAVKELLNLARSFPDHFDESVMFNGVGVGLKEEFRQHFLNISRVMDCVSCDKCKLWGKLQVTGLGTALKILFADDSKKIISDNEGDVMMMQTSYSEIGPDFKLSRNEIVALFNAFGRISTSIRQLERFREMLK